MLILKNNIYLMKENLSGFVLNNYTICKVISNLACGSIFRLQPNRVEFIYDKKIGINGDNWYLDISYVVENGFSMYKVRWKNNEFESKLEFVKAYFIEPLPEIEGDNYNLIKEIFKYFKSTSYYNLLT